MVLLQWISADLLPVFLELLGLIHPRLHIVLFHNHPGSHLYPQGIRKMLSMAVGLSSLFDSPNRHVGQKHILYWRILEVPLHISYVPHVLPFSVLESVPLRN